MRYIIALICLCTIVIISNGLGEERNLIHNTIMGRLKVDDQYPLVFANEQIFLLKNIKVTNLNSDFSFHFPEDVNAHTVAVGMVGHDTAGHVLLTYRDGVVRKNRTVFLKITKYDKSTVVDYTDDITKASVFKAHRLDEKSKNVRYEYSLDSYLYECMDENKSENRFLSYYENPSKISSIKSDITAHPLRLNTKEKASVFSLYQEAKTGK